jgi:hypothetical protein
MSGQDDDRRNLSDPKLTYKNGGASYEGNEVRRDAVGKYLQDEGYIPELPENRDARVMKTQQEIDKWDREIDERNEKNTIVKLPFGVTIYKKGDEEASVNTNTRLAYQEADHGSKEVSGPNAGGARVKG